MSNSSNASSGGIGLTGATFIVFLVLKLTGNIAWSWRWVTAPLWGVVALLVAVLAIVIPIAFVVDAVSGRRARRHNADIIARNARAS